VLPEYRDRLMSDSQAGDCIECCKVVEHSFGVPDGLRSFHLKTAFSFWSFPLSQTTVLTLPTILEPNGDLAPMVFTLRSKYLRNPSMIGLTVLFETRL